MPHSSPAFCAGRFPSIRLEAPPTACRRGENYTLVHASNFESCPPDVIPRPTTFAHLPFAHLRQSGFGYATLLVEPPIFLGKMHADLQAANIAFNAREFQDLSDVAELTETVVVNCTGLGSKTICKDRLMVSVRGQLVLLPHQPNLQYLFAGHGGYLFPRQDSVVVGGSEEFGVTDPTPSLQMCRSILANMKRVFTAGEALALAPELLPSWAMRSK